MGGAADTTNNRMELMAMIEGLRMLPADAETTLYSDSNLCVQTVNEWAAGWERRGWKRKTGPIANLELVKELWALDQRPADGQRALDQGPRRLALERVRRRHRRAGSGQGRVPALATPLEKAPGSPDAPRPAGGERRGCRRRPAARGSGAACRRSASSTCGSRSSACASRAAGWRTASPSSGSSSRRAASTSIPTCGSRTSGSRRAACPASRSPSTWCTRGSCASSAA